MDYAKTEDNKLKVSQATQSEAVYSLEELLRDKESAEQTIANLQEKVAMLDKLIAKCTELGVGEQVLPLE